MTEPTMQKGKDSTGGLPLTVVGFFLYALAGLPVLFGGLIMPIYAVALLGLFWVVGLVLAIRWRERRMAFLALPFLMVAVWFGVAWFGETFLDWTA
jgi:hypothetical protein